MRNSLWAARYFVEQFFSHIAKILDLTDEFWLVVSVPGSVPGNPEPYEGSRSREPKTLEWVPFLGTRNSRMGSRFRERGTLEWVSFLGTRNAHELSPKRK